MIFVGKREGGPFPALPWDITIGRAFSNQGQGRGVDNIGLVTEFSTSATAAPEPARSRMRAWLDIWHAVAVLVNLFDGGVMKLCRFIGMLILKFETEAAARSPTHSADTRKVYT